MKSNILKFKQSTLLIVLTALIALSCSSGDDSSQKSTKENKKNGVEATGQYGVGPIKNVNLPPEVDPALAGKGKAIFEGKCTACHKFEERYVGPALAGITERRNPAWIMNMIMNPEEMTQKDPIAKKLLAEYMTQMVNQNVTEEDARALVEYFRSVN